MLGTAEGEARSSCVGALILLDEMPNELTDTYYPLAVAQGPPWRVRPRSVVAPSRCSPNSATSASWCARTLTAAMPDGGRPGPGDRTDEPVLRLTRVTLDREDHPIQVDDMVMPALGGGCARIEIDGGAAVGNGRR
ncbi:hypothetical protein STENM327S_05313 [Streptomyces tendae]